MNASLQYLGIVYSCRCSDDRVTSFAVLGIALIVGAALSATLLRSRSLANDSGPPPAES